MIKIGEYNRLKVLKEVDFGIYLDGGNGVEILLPTRYVPDNTSVGDELDVFVYTDSEDRLIATTLQPFAKVGEFAFLEVNDVNSTGAFLDWGLSKDILVPYSEQKSKMIKGGLYLVYVYLDETTKRVVASAKYEKFIGNLFPKYKRGDVVSALIVSHDDRGYKTIVDNRYWGMIYNTDIFKNLEIGETMTARVNQIREDGKIDLAPGADTGTRVRELAEKIYYLTDAADGHCMLNDNSTPAEIKSLLQCSKKDFKKAAGFLLKNGVITMDEKGISLIATWEDKIGSSNVT